MMKDSNNKASIVTIAIIGSIIAFFIGFVLELVVTLNNPIEVEASEVTTQEAELKMFNEVMNVGSFEERISKEYIYYIESGFSYNNIYLPVNEINKSSGKIGVCQLHTSYGKNLWEQDKDCTKYMEARYGSWKNAYEFHKRNGWW